MTKKILFVVGGAIASISILVLMILDLILIKDVVYNDGWGTNFEMNSDYVAMFIVSLAFLIYGIYSLLAKNMILNYNIMQCLLLYHLLCVFIL